LFVDNSEQQTIGVRFAFLHDGLSGVAAGFARVRKCQIAVGERYTRERCDDGYHLRITFICLRPSLRTGQRQEIPCVPLGLPLLLRETRHRKNSGEGDNCRQLSRTIRHRHLHRYLKTLIAFRTLFAFFAASAISSAVSMFSANSAAFIAAPIASRASIPR